MLRPNLAMDAPPEVIFVGGAPYRANVDYRVWLKVLELTREMYRAPEDERDEFHNLKVVFDMEKLVFGGVLADEKPREALQAITDFLRGYPEPPAGLDESTGERVLSLGRDINYVLLAIRNQGGPDLSYKRSEPFHWWEFLLEVRSLCGEHYILRLMRVRGYEDASIKPEGWASREAMRLKRAYALPYEMNADEKRAAERFERLTGGK